MCNESVAAEFSPEVPSGINTFYLSFVKLLFLQHESFLFSKHKCFNGEGFERLQVSQTAAGGRVPRRQTGLETQTAMIQLFDWL